LLESADMGVDPVGSTYVQLACAKVKLDADAPGTSFQHARFESHT